MKELAPRVLPRRKSSRFKAEWAWGYFFVAPTIIGLLVLNFYTLFQTIILSLQRSQGLGATKFIGFANYVKMFSTQLTWYATRNTALFLIITVPVGVFIALVVASLLNTNIRGRNIYRGIYFLPMVVAPAAISMVWKWLFNGEIGIINQFLKLFDIIGPNWVSDPDTALISCCIINIWSGLGYDVVMLLAGLQSISKTYYEASDIDGANAVQKFFKITIPMVSPTLFFVVIMRSIGSMMTFDVIYMLIKKSNPAYKQAVTLMPLFYSEAFESFNKGYASAIVVWSVMLIMIITAIHLFAEKKFVHY